MSELAPTEPPKAPRAAPRPRPRAIGALAWVILGALVGVGATIAVVRRADHAPGESVRVAERRAMPPRPSGDAPKGDQRPATPPPAQPIESSSEDESMRAAGAGAPTALAGSLPPGSVSPVNPVVIEGGAGDGLKESRFLEMSVSVPQVDVESVVSAVTKASREAGGEAHPFVIPKTSTDRERSGLLVLVPDDRLETMQSQIAALGMASVRFEWKGPLGDRRFRVERPLRDALSDLEREERALTEKYFDDAPSVVDVRERIEAVRKALDSLPSPKQEFAVIRVYIGHRV